MNEDFLSNHDHGSDGDCDDNDDEDDDDDDDNVKDGDNHIKDNNSKDNLDFCYNKKNIVLLIYAHFDRLSGLL